MATLMTPAARRLQALVPAALLLLFVLVEAVPTGVPHFADVTPQLTLIGVFYWSIYRPDLLPAWLAFAVGLLHDLLNAGPIGLMPFLLVAMHAFCAAQRRVFVGKSFAVGWWAFGMVAFGFAALDWLFATAYYFHLMNPRPLCVQTLLTVAIYPALNWLFNRVEMTVLRGA